MTEIKADSPLNSCGSLVFEPLVKVFEFLISQIELEVDVDGVLELNFGMDSRFCPLPFRLCA